MAEPGPRNLRTAASAAQMVPRELLQVVDAPLMEVVSAASEIAIGVGGGTQPETKWRHKNAFTQYPLSYKAIKCVA